MAPAYSLCVALPGIDCQTANRVLICNVMLLRREKNRIEAVSSAVLAASSARTLGVNMANQMKKRVHAAKVRAADKTTLIVHPNVREERTETVVASSVRHQLPLDLARTPALTGLQLSLKPNRAIEVGLSLSSVVFDYF